MALALTTLKLSAGLAIVAVVAALQCLVLLALLPSRQLRIRSCYLFERLVGSGCLWVSGCRMTVEGAEHLAGNRPAIYIVNHTSLLDLFVALRIMPSKAVGIAKKEVVRYPFFGQMYLLTGHLRIDRGNRERAIRSMRSLARLVKRRGLSVIMAPEGTRSRDGRLRPFKKGVVHLAAQTGLPVVPIVIHGAHLSCEKSTLSVRGVPIRVQVLSPVETTGWTVEHSDVALAELTALYSTHLPADQVPVAS